MIRFLTRQIPVKGYKGLVYLLGLFYVCCFWVFPVDAQVLTSDDVATSHHVIEHTAHTKPDLLLLKSYQPGQPIQDWLMSEKLDGVRAYWNGKQLMSRNGQVFSAPKWFTADFPPFELDGELWLAHGQFEETVSIVKTYLPDERWKKITYQIFEVPNQAGALLERLQVLKAYLTAFPSPSLRIIEQNTVQNDAQIQKRLSQVLTAGGEGLVLRHPQALYHTGRSSQALKVKLKEDAECVVQGYTAGNGKYQNKVGALQCLLRVDQFSKLSGQDRLIKIGSGLTDQLRQNPPAIGTLVTFQHIGLTDKGSPRFPVFLRVRKDKD